MPLLRTLFGKRSSKVAAAPTAPAPAVTTPAVAVPTIVVPTVATLTVNTSELPSPQSLSLRTLNSLFSLRSPYPKHDDHLNACIQRTGEELKRQTAKESAEADARDAKENSISSCRRVG
jgi:hypothetical protein